MKFCKPIIRLFVILCLMLLAAAPQAAYGKFTIVVLPDTQNYSTSYPAIFTEQTEWIVDNKSTLKIAFVAHEGDVVNTSTNATEYNRADTSMDILDAGAISYGMGPGNHDMGSGSLYPSYFGTWRFSAKPYFQPDSSYDDYNHYFLFTADGMDFIIIFLQYAPTAAIRDWADARLKAHPNHRGIVVSHSILNVGGTQTSWTTEGQNIFNALSDNPNLFLMLCGHNHGEGRRTDTGTNGNTIYSLLADYQNDANGGNGFLRILEFDPATDQINVMSYSPYTDTYKTAGSSQFSLSYNMLYGDINAIDCDVDGSDLAGWIADYAHKAIDVTVFANNFGKTACQ